MSNTKASHAQETKLEAARQQVIQGEADVARQHRIIENLRRDGHSTLGAQTMLRLMEQTLKTSRDMMNFLENRQ